MTWEAITAIGAFLSMIASVLTALYIRAELKALEKDRYLDITTSGVSTRSSGSWSCMVAPDFS
jgi:hypothetical protein